jgi:hypothetical protein
MREMAGSSKIIFVAAILIALVAGAYLLFVAVTEKPGCHVRPSEQVDIVFDKTKRYSPTQAHSVDRTIREILSNAAANAEINFFYISADADRPFLVLNVCRPDTKVSRLVGDPQQQEREFQRRVVDEVKKKIDLPFMPKSPAPIIESLDTLSRERIITAQLEQRTKVEFFIYSDMVQSSRGESLENCRDRAPTESESFKAVHGNVKHFFEDIPVQVFAIHRDPATNPGFPAETCLRGFWEETFQHLSWTPL